MKEPIVQSSEEDPRSARRMIVAFLATFALACIAVAGASVWSNHFGAFGDVGRFHTFNGRAAKTEYLARQERSSLAEAWVVGSSNTMPFQPATVERLFGLRTFDLGVFWGRIEDSWAWVNFLLRDLGTKPKMIVLGLEPWSFSADDSGPPLYRRYRRRLLNTRALAKYLDDYSPLKHTVSSLLDTVSDQNLRILAEMTLRQGFTRRRHGSLEGSSILTDGTWRPYNERDPEPFLPPELNAFYSELSEGSLDLEDPEVRRRRDEWLARGLISNDDIQSYLPGARLSEDSLELLGRTLRLCQENDIEVGIVMLPVHPYFYDLLARDTDHEQHLARLRARLHALQAELPVVRAVLDASHVRLFGGSPFEFFDRLHMTADNTDKVLEALRQAWDGER